MLWTEILVPRQLNHISKIPARRGLVGMSKKYITYSQNNT